MRRFRLLRNEDATGISGTGYIAEGVEFSTGKCALAWLTKYSSVALYDNIATLEAIHGHGGKTLIEWEDAHTTTLPAAKAPEDEPCPACRQPVTGACPFRCKP